MKVAWGSDALCARLGSVQARSRGNTAHGKNRAIQETYLFTRAFDDAQGRRAPIGRRMLLRPMSAIGNRNPGGPWSHLQIGPRTGSYLTSRDGRGSQRGKQKTRADDRVTTNDPTGCYKTLKITEPTLVSLKTWSEPDDGLRHATKRLAKRRVSRRMFALFDDLLL